MSIHRSLVSKSTLKRHRNVLSRAERIKQLEDEGKWTEGESVFGLPKVRVHRVKAGSRHKKAAQVAQAAEEAVKGEEGKAEG